MSPTNRKVLIFCILIAGFAFITFAFPNAKGAQDVQMLSVFEPDEYAQYPVVQKMLNPKPTLRQRINDYLNPNAIGIDQETFLNSQTFYLAVKQGHLDDYHLVYEDETGLIFVSNNLYKNYYEN